MGVNVGQILYQGARRHPEREALVCLESGARFSYAALDRRARQAAAALAAAGVGPRDRVSLCAGNSPDYVAAWFGALYLGAACAPAPAMSAPPELAHRLDDAGATLSLCDDETLARCEAGAALATRTVPVRRLASLFEAPPPPLSRPVDTAADQPALLLYTSGTTGRAKGATLTHASLQLHTAALCQHSLDLGPSDRVLAALPLTHSFGLRMTLLCPFFVGATVFLRRRFVAARCLEDLEGQAITWTAGVPTMFARYGALPPGPAPRALRWCLSAGAPLPDATAEAASQRLGAPLRQGYGMTEATFSTLDGPPAPATRGSVGRPVWGIELQITGPDGAPLPAGAVGEIWLRGHNVMAGYFGDEASSQAALEGGWMCSGDLGRLDSEGRLWVVDRLKDTILRGGFNVYPAEVEAALARHPEVALAVVIGLPHPELGEEVVAVVQRRPGSALRPEALIEWARGQLSGASRPRRVHLVEALPLGPSGKLSRRAVRAQLLGGDDS